MQAGMHRTAETATQQGALLQAASRISQQISTLEIEHNDALSVAQTCSTRAKRLVARLQSLQEYEKQARQHARVSPQSARALPGQQTRLLVQGALDKNISRGKNNLALAAKLEQYVTLLQGQLRRVAAGDGRLARQVLERYRQQQQRAGRGGGHGRGGEAATAVNVPRTPPAAGTVSAASDDELPVGVRPGAGAAAPGASKRRGTRQQQASGDTASGEEGDDSLARFFSRRPLVPDDVPPSPAGGPASSAGPAAFGANSDSEVLPPQADSGGSLQSELAGAQGPPAQAEAGAGARRREHPQDQRQRQHPDYPLTPPNTSDTSASDDNRPASSSGLAEGASSGGSRVGQPQRARGGQRVAGAAGGAGTAHSGAASSTKEDGAGSGSVPGGRYALAGEDVPWPRTTVPPPQGAARQERRPPPTASEGGRGGSGSGSSRPTGDELAGLRAAVRRLVSELQASGYAGGEDAMRAVVGEVAPLLGAARGARARQ